MKPRYIQFWCLTLTFLTCKPQFGGTQRRQSQLRIGKGINVSERYGYLGISMRVVPQNDKFETERWLFKEPTKNLYMSMENQTMSQEANTPGIFHGDFHMEFCDNRRQLFQAYFRDFSIEHLDNAWEAFTGGWIREMAAKKLGINDSFINGDYSFVLVRVVRFRETGKLKGEIPADQPMEVEVRERVASLRVNNTNDVVDFMESFGTHYISSYTTGNSLFQVFVYKRKNYQMIKERIKSKGINGISRENLMGYFAPWFATHLGQIRSASANATVERWARRKLQNEHFVVKYVSLLKLHGNSTLLRALDSLLENDALLKLDLRSLKVLFREYPIKQNWFVEVLDNYMKLWQVTMQ